MNGSSSHNKKDDVQANWLQDSTIFTMRLGKALPGLAQKGNETSFRRKEIVLCVCTYTETPKSRETRCLGQVVVEMGSHTGGEHSARSDECYRSDDK